MPVFKVGPHLLINFIIVGFLAALSGILLSTQMGASTPNLGRDFELWTITAVVLGGTKLTGGLRAALSAPWAGSSPSAFCATG